MLVLIHKNFIKTIRVRLDDWTAGIELGTNTKSDYHWKWATIPYQMFGCRWNCYLESRDGQIPNKCLDVHLVELN